MIMTGPPGAGKTLLARSVPSILPRMGIDEALDVTIDSVAGMLPADTPLVMHRPFRAPHHTVSYAALVGGGEWPRPGEVSLAHRGVLFLDELPEFEQRALEALRQPLEDRVVTISRVQGTITFPADFIFIAACNPCPCGYRGDPKRECTCSESMVTRYGNRISGPLLDRIDIHVEVPRVDYGESRPMIDWANPAWPCASEWRRPGAKDQGDITDNAEYEDAKIEQAFVEGRIWSSKPRSATPC